MDTYENWKSAKIGEKFSEEMRLDLDLFTNIGQFCPLHWNHIDYKSSEQLFCHFKGTSYARS